MLVHIKEIVKKAQKGKYAVGAFNTVNLEVTLAIVKAAVAKKSPAIIQVSESTIKYSGLKPITHIVETVAKNEAVDVPIALHLDHGRSFHSVAECINAGFSSIMIDASDLPFDEDTFLTKNVVEYAHKRGVWVQGEVGRLKGIEGNVSVAEREAVMTKPEEAVEYIKKTEIDTLAVAVGQCHGITKMRKGVPNLDLKRLARIKKAVKNIPLVLHGASGIPRDQIRKAIGYGVRIINIDTEIRMAFAAAVREFLDTHPEEVDPRKILTPAIEAMQSVVERKMEMFGSVNKA